MMLNEAHNVLIDIHNIDISDGHHVNSPSSLVPRKFRFV